MNTKLEIIENGLKKLDVVKEFYLYDFQYRNAIYNLLNDKNAEEHIYPTLALIHQMLENQLKMQLIESTNNKKTLKMLRVENTHDLKCLIEKDEFRIYYEEIESIYIIYCEYKKSIIYFYEILGKDTFLNSRYPIERYENISTVKKNINYKELYENWNKYSLLSAEMLLIGIAYSYSNTVFYLLEKGWQREKIKEKMKSVISETCMGIEEMIVKVLNYLDLYIKRNKYIDYGYVC